MHQIVLLGNPGEDYERTRHNVAWFLADENFYATLKLDKREVDHYLKAKTASGRVGHEPVLVVWPQTFMNRSGETVEKLVSAEAGETLIVVHDDIDLSFGQVRVAFGGGDAGHKGIKSISDSLGSKAFVRVRVGIGRTSFLTGKMLPRPSGEALNKYVLGNLSLRDKRALKTVAQKLPSIITSIVSEGYKMAMNRFN